MNILRSATGKRWLGVNCSHGREARSAKRFVLTQCNENRVLSILNECLYQGQLTNDPSSCAGYFMCVHDKLQPFTCQDGTHWDDSQKVNPQLPLLFPDHPSNHPSPQKINQRFATIPNLLVAPVMAVPLLLDLPLPLLGEKE